MIKKAIEIDYAEGEDLDRVEWKGKIVLRRLGWMEMNRMKSESSEIKSFGTTSQVKVDSAQMQLLSVAKSMVAGESLLTKTTFVEDRTTKAHIPVSAPIDVTLDMLNSPEFPVAIGDQLFLAFLELNEISEKKGAG